MEVSKRMRILEELFAFEHTTFDICLVYIGVVFASLLTSISIYKIILITLAFFSARAAAMIMNRYVGREIDLMDKKKGRRASMSVPKNTLLAIFIFSGAILIVSSYLLNALALILAPLALAWFILDPMLKPRTTHRHYDIGLMQGFGFFGGYIGASGMFPMMLPLYLLLIAIIFIGGGSDVIYTVSHIEFDKKHRLKTYAAEYGAKKALRYSLYSHILAALFMIAFGISSGYLVIAVGAIVASGVLLYEHSSVNYDKKSFRLYGIAHYKGYVGIILLVSALIAITGI